jgi:hypothetical protein
VKKLYILLYQAGIANVYESGQGERPARRVLQSDYRACEHYCLGLLEAGAGVEVWNANVAGDPLLQPDAWQKGKGGPFAESQRPPVYARYARKVSA